MLHKGGVCPLPNVGREPREVTFLDKVITYANSPEVKTVVIGAQWLGYLGNNRPKSYLYGEGNLSMDFYFQQALNDFQEFIKKLINKGKNVYIITNIPNGGSYDPKSFFIVFSIFDDRF